MVQTTILVKIPEGPNLAKEPKSAISLEIFNLDLENSPPPPTKIGVWWVARLKFAISLENVIRFNLA